jgi:hypothetical protein
MRRPSSSCRHPVDTGYAVCVPLSDDVSAVAIRDRLSRNVGPLCHGLTFTALLLRTGFAGEVLPVEFFEALLMHRGVPVW